MGLTSGQGRLLMLTSRLSDIQLDMMMVSQRQNRLAWQSEKAAKEYNEKTTNMKLVMKINDADSSSGYKTDDMTYENMTSMGYIVTDAQNRIYLTKEIKKDEKGEPVLDDKGNPVYEWAVPSADRLAVKEIFDSGVTEEDGKNWIVYKGKKCEVVDGTEILSDKSKLQNSLMNGRLFVLNTTGNDTSGSNINQLESNTSISYVYDTSDDAAAESKYNYETARISKQDNMLDLEMDQLETQHQAIAKEIESVKKLIDNNVEKTFNLFNHS